MYMQAYRIFHIKYRRSLSLSLSLLFPDDILRLLGVSSPVSFHQAILSLEFDKLLFLEPLHISIAGVRPGRTWSRHFGYKSFKKTIIDSNWDTVESLTCTTITVVRLSMLVKKSQILKYTKRHFDVNRKQLNICLPFLLVNENLLLWPTDESCC